MDDKNKTIRCVIYSIAACFCVVVLTIGGCTAHNSTLTANVIKNSADPIKAVCALGTVVSDVCMAAILHDEKQPPK